MNNILDDFKIYRDEFGLNQANTNGLSGVVSQNGMLFTIEYLLCLMKNKHLILRDELADEIKHIEKTFQLCEPLPGLTIRFPGSTEFDSMDNLTAALVFSGVFADRAFAKRMRDHGLTIKCTGVDQTQQQSLNNKFYPLAKVLGLGSPRNYWNNQHPELFCLFSWFGRSPGFMGLIDIAATGDSTTWRKFGLLVGQMIPVIKNTAADQDGWKLSFVTWQILKDRSIIWKMAYGLWERRLYKLCPKGIKDIYQSYYNDKNHPLIRYS